MQVLRIRDKGSMDVRPEKRNLSRLISCAILITLWFCLHSFAGGIKEPNVAGAFYPQGKEELSSMVDKMLEQAHPAPVEGDVFLLISPHAGYGYSGPCAANGYKLIKGRPYKTVIVIGTSHHYAFSGFSVYKDGAFRTPLGEIKVDADFAAKLLDKDEQVIFEPRAFGGNEMDNGKIGEHSIEVQLPFLQKVLADFKIVPVIAGDCSLEQCKGFASLLKEAIGERKDILVVVSTDMYHGYDFEEARSTDQDTLSYIKDMDSQGLYYGLRDSKLQLCGGFGLVSGLILAKELGHGKVSVLCYTDSAQVTGNETKGAWTVGYASIAIDQEKGEQGMLNKEQRKKLLEIARQTIKRYLETGEKPELAETDPRLKEICGAFVTLHEYAKLRGCIGNIIGHQPLYLTVRDMAIAAAFEDPRFAPLEKDELERVKIEISVLSVPKRVGSCDEIRLSEHGVVLTQGPYSAVFLPQVATETGWTKEEFLSQLAQKAGLEPGAWKDKETKFDVFTAEVFSE